MITDMGMMLDSCKRSGRRHFINQWLSVISVLSVARWRSFQIQASANISAKIRVGKTTLPVGVCNAGPA